MLFVNAPSVKDLTDFQNKRGLFWQQKCHERVHLNLRDIKRRHARRIQTNMKKYYCTKQQLRQEHVADPELMPLQTRCINKEHFGLFSVDGTHPNDVGYEFWGRYIAHAIIQEWKRKQDQEQESLQSQR